MRRRLPDSPYRSAESTWPASLSTLFGSGGLAGPDRVLKTGASLGPGDPNDGTNVAVDSSGDTLLPGKGVPYGWLVTPHDGTGLTAADVEAIVARGIAEATQVRAQIRLPFNVPTKMVFAVSDLNGNILGLYRMPDATYFSIARGGRQGPKRRVLR